MAINIGIIGAGKIVRVRHLPEIKSNPLARIAAICDVVEARAKEMALEYDCKAYFDYRQMLLDPGIDAVIVAATNTTHAEMSIAALQAGKHVLCEKPMATSLSDARKMLDAAKASGKQLMIAQNQRLEPAHVKAKEIIQSGELGKILSFTTIFGHPGCEYWAIDGKNTWFFRSESAGMGVLGDLAVHKLDLMRFLLDDDYTSASATIDTLAKAFPDGTPITVEDNAICTMQTAKGALGSVITSWTYQVELNRTSVYGEKGVVEIYADPEFPLIVQKNPDTGTYFRLGKKSTNIEQVKSGIIDAFVNALEDGTDVPIPGIEGYKALEALMACYQSAKSGKRVNIGT
ncbi:MAG: Gfo/Idh/MocA family oxidoreductase [Anaerolineaceae bacterium]